MSSLEDSTCRLSAGIGLSWKGKMLGLSSRPFRGADPLSRAWSDASTS
jgi:hypothetical protein